jgi:mono/diheme cytochrome c family protein
VKNVSVLLVLCLASFAVIVACSKSGSSGGNSAANTAATAGAAAASAAGAMANTAASAAGAMANTAASAAGAAVNTAASAAGAAANTAASAAGNAMHGMQNMAMTAKLPIPLSKLPSATVGAGDVAAGAKVFSANCESCHGAGGKNGTVGPTLAGTGIKAGQVAYMVQNPQGVDKDSGMPKLPLSSKDIADVSAYVASLK